MTIMMSDSLKDIVSIGQLSGNATELTVALGDETFEFDIYSFSVDLNVIHVLAFSSREFIAKVIKNKNVKSSVQFEGESIGAGTVMRVGYEPMFINNEPHDMLMVDIKRDT